MVETMELPQYNKDLDVRVLTAEDLPEARRVAGRAFRQHAEDWYEAETSLGGFDQDGRLVCALGYQKESLWWGPAQIPAAAIYCVAADPKHQRQGHAGGLMVRSIHDFREKGFHVCPLWPFSYKWYGKFGWTCPAPSLEVKLWPDLLRVAGAGAGTIRQATPEDLSVVHQLYSAGARLRNGQSVRSEEFWKKEHILKNLWVLEGEKGGLACSAEVSMRDIPRGQGKNAVVREMHGASFEAQHRLVRSLAELDDVAALKLELPFGSLFLQVFQERYEIIVSHDLAMRVVDVGQALQHLKPPEDLHARISFEVKDWVVDANKPIAVTANAKEGQVEVDRGSGKDALRCDINTFTQLFAGGLSAAQARELGRLEGGNPKIDAACNSLLWGRVPYRSGLETG